MKIVLILSLVLLGSCVSRSEVEGNIWNADRLPESLCRQYPALRGYGFFRVISCKGRESLDVCQGGVPSYDETIPYCSGRAENMLAADRAHVAAWLKALGKPR